MYSISLENIMMYCLGEMQILEKYRHYGFSFIEQCDKNHWQFLYDAETSNFYVSKSSF